MVRLAVSGKWMPAMEIQWMAGQSFWACGRQAVQVRPASCFRRRTLEVPRPCLPMMKKRRILMFVENSYPNDPRVKNECDVLAAAGYPITVVALRRKGQPRSDMIDGVRVYRVPRLELFEKVPYEN